MKQVTLLIIMLVVLITAGIFEISYFKDSSEYVKSDVNYILNIMKNDNISAAKEHFTKLDDTIKNVNGSWGIFLDHNTLQQLENNIEVFKIYVERGNMEKAEVYAQNIYNLLENISDVHRITFQNVI